MKQKLMGISLVLLILGFSETTHAQKYRGDEQTFHKGTVTLSLGVGISADYKYKLANGGTGVKTALEVGAFNAGDGVISIGYEMGSAFSNAVNKQGFKNYRSRMFLIGARTAWHTDMNKRNLDVYFGLTVGAGFRHYDYDIILGGNYKENDVAPYLRGFAGASFYFTSKLGVNVEVGNDISYAQGGLIYRLSR